MAVTQKVTLYNNKFTVPPVINAVQNDTDRQVEAYFGDFTLQVGMTGKLSFIRSDGTHYEVSATLSTANNTATAELDQALTQAGVTQAQLKITDSGNVGSTFTFMIKVQPDVAGISQQQDGYSAEELAQGISDNASAIANIENVELPKKADQDGYYEDLTSGTSLAVLGTPTTESVPYLFRRSASIGVRESDKIIGGTVAWNQMVKNGDFSNGTTDWIVSQYLTTTVADKVMTTVCTSSGDRYNVQNIPFTVGHKYFLAFDGYSDSSNYQSNSIAVVYFGSASNYKDFRVSSANTWQSFSAMFECVSNTFNVFRLRNAVQGDTNKFRNVRIIDLTAMLGSTIADYIYGLESGTAGAGIAMLKLWGFLTKDYYAYDSGSLQSVKTSAHIMRDADDNIIGDYPLDSSLDLRGIPKLDGSNKLYYDGDSYASDGTVTRRYAIAKVTSASTTGTTRTNGDFYAPINGITNCKPVADNNTRGNAGCNVAENMSASERFASTASAIAVRTNGVIEICIAGFTTATALNNYLSTHDVYVYYELATPTTETAGPFHDPQICSPYGTEEYVDTRDVPVPVGHETEYYADPVAEIERVAVMLPAPPTTSGTFRLTCVVSGGVPTYSWTS